MIFKVNLPLYVRITKPIRAGRAAEINECSIYFEEIDPIEKLECNWNPGMRHIVLSILSRTPYTCIEMYTRA